VALVSQDFGKRVDASLRPYSVYAPATGLPLCAASFPVLHFELCYYRAIDYAIARRLQRVEAGAQGRHKIRRGYLPARTYSAHWIAHGGLRRAVADFLDHERPAIEAEMVALAEESPFRKCGED